MMTKKTILTGLFVSLLFISACGQTGQEKDPAVPAAGDNSREVAGGKPVALDKEKFLAEVMDYQANPEQWKYKGEKPAMIDFYADWCGPCKITSPIIDELAEEYEGQILFYKIDTDEEKELAQVFGIRGIPSFLYIPMEGKPTMSSGIAKSPEKTKEMFREMIEQVLLSPDSNNKNQN